MLFIWCDNFRNQNRDSQARRSPPNCPTKEGSSAAKKPIECFVSKPEINTASAYKRLSLTAWIWSSCTEFWVDPFRLFLLGASLFIISFNYKIANQLYAFGAAILTSFTFEGVALYLDWYRWVIPGIVDLKGSYIRFDHGLTRINKDAFPAWIAMMFLALYLLWFVIGCETAKKTSSYNEVFDNFNGRSRTSSHPISYPIPIPQPLTATL